MNKPLTLTAILVMGASLAMAQAGGSTEQKAPKNPKVELNPQPEPPGVQKSKSNKVKLNPQPEPPGIQKKSPPPQPQPRTPENSRPTTGSEKVELNPQPLPPGAHNAGGTTDKTKQQKKSTKKGTADTGSAVPK